MRTTVELPDDLFRKAKARAALQGRALKDLVADGLKLLLKTPEEMQPTLVKVKRPGNRRAPAERTRKRGSASTWVERFAGVAALAPTETTDDARMDHYAKKYGV